MFDRISRSSCLLIFAACNLLFWVAAAAGVGLAVSDQLDLGVETLIRQQQGTAVVVWDRVISGAEQVTAIPTKATLAANTTVPGPTSVEINAVKTSVAQAVASTPATTTILSPSPMPAPTSTTTTPIQSNPAVATALTPSSASVPSQPTPIPTPTIKPISSPLLMSDLHFNSWARLNQEMGRSAVGRRVLIGYSEAMLNNEIATMLQNSPDLPYRNVHVDLKRDQVVVTGDVMVLGFDVSTEIEGTVQVEDCRPKMEIRSISIAGLLTPGFVKEQVKEMVLEALDWYPDGYPLCLEEILLEEERATVFGRRR
jgi:hypothetical protein